MLCKIVVLGSDSFFRFYVLWGRLRGVVELIVFKYKINLYFII